MFVFSFLLLSCEIHGEDPLKEEKRVASQQEGLHYAKELCETYQWIDLDAVIDGIRQYAHRPALVDGLQDTVNEQYWQVRLDLYEAEANENLRQASQFLKEISQKATVTVIEEGNLAYEVIENGDGERRVSANSTPLLHYTFSTLDGEKIVSTHKEECPIRVPLPDVILGFAKGIEGMRKGEKRRIYIHPELGYGKTGHVPPNALLIGEVELIDF